MNSKSGVVILAATVAAVALLVPSRAAAQDEHNTYVAVKFGPYFPTESNPFNAISQSVENWPTKYEVGGAFGHYWGIFGLQLSASYLTTGTSDVDFKAIPILLIARFRLPLGIVAPYAEGGAGVAISSLKGLGADQTKAAFEGIGGFGVDIYLGQFLLGAEAKYLWLNPGFTVTNIQDFKFNGITVQAYVGYMW
jgi:hypothetical protein